jgi:hypothetical protein
VSEGHADEPELREKGEACFGIVIEAAAACLKRSPADPLAQQAAYMLWTCVHGHSFLTIDQKTDVLVDRVEDGVFLMAISRAILGSVAQG